MKNQSPNAKSKSEHGVALFIAIFALLLISVVAMSLMVMAGTETSLNSNYKGSVQAFTTPEPARKRGAAGYGLVAPMRSAPW
jgi:hypothetical protein